MMNAEKNTAILSEAIEALSPRGNSLDSQIFSVAHILQRIKGEENPYQEQIDKLYDIASDISQIIQSLQPENTDSPILAKLSLPVLLLLGTLLTGQ